MKCTRTGVNWKYPTCERGKINILVEEFEACLDTQSNDDCSSPHNEESGVSGKKKKSPGLSICVPSPTLWLRNCLCRTRGGMKTTKLKNERSQSLHHSQSHTGKGGAGELHESKIRFPPPLFSLWLVRGFRGYSPGVSTYWPLQWRGNNSIFSMALKVWGGKGFFLFNNTRALINRRKKSWKK